MKRKLIIENNPQPSPSLNEDVINLIAKHVSYKHGLAAFRQTSKDHNEIIEKTDAGKRARRASNLQPLSINKFFQTHEIRITTSNKIIKEVVPYMGGLLAFGDIINFPDGYNELSIGVNCARGIVKLLSGLFIAEYCLDYPPRLSEFNSLWDWVFPFVGLALANIIIGILTSLFALIISSGYRGIIEVPGFDVFPKSFSKCSPSDHVALRETARTFDWTVFTAISNDTAIICAAASLILIAQVKLFSNDVQVRRAQRDQSLIRSTLCKPDNQEPKIEKYTI